MRRGRGRWNGQPHCAYYQVEEGLVPSKALSNCLILSREVSKYFPVLRRELVEASFPTQDVKFPLHGVRPKRSQYVLHCFPLLLLFDRARPARPARALRTRRTRKVSLERHGRGQRNVSPVIFLLRIRLPGKRARTSTRAGTSAIPASHRGKGEASH